MMVSLKHGGRTPLDRASFEKVNIRDLERCCAVCGRSCWVCSHRSRSLQTLNGSWVLEGRGRKCSNPECTEATRREPPWKWWELSHLLVKGTSYGLDVLCYVGKAYLLKSVSLPRLHKELCETYGVQISERHVSNLFKLFLSLVEGRNLSRRCVLDRLKEQGGIILSADAVTFDETSPSLCVVRDVLSGEILYAQRLDGANGKRTELYAQIFEKVKSCGVPVKGVVTDKEASLVAAVREVFPGVPHQFCQVHYLQNLRKSFEPELSEMAKAVREVVKMTKEVEREVKAASTAPEERHLALEFCRVIKTQGKTQGDNLTNPSPFKRYARLNRVLEAVEKARQKPGTWLYLNRLSGILSGLNAKRDLGRLLERQLGVVRAVAHVFKEGGASASDVAQSLSDYLNSLGEMDYPDLRWTSFVNGSERLTERYWPGLFHCYDLEDLPATNNELESFFGALKRQQRRVTGKTATSGGPIETCASYVLGAWNTVQRHPDLVPLLRDIPEQELAEARERLQKLAEPAKLKRSIARDADSYLSDLLAEWLDPDDLKV